VDRIFFTIADAQFYLIAKPSYGVRYSFMSVRDTAYVDNFRGISGDIRTEILAVWLWEEELSFANAQFDFLNSIVLL
jgi:hypothetical protein